MTERSGIFAGDDPFVLARAWMAEAREAEINDPDAAALATVDSSGLPNVRMVLMREIEDQGFVFYTNYGSAKGQELLLSGKAAFVIHWKSLRRQLRVRGTVTKEDGPQADAYFHQRSVKSRLGALASHQSAPLDSREDLMERLAALETQFGENPPRPDHWGGFRIVPEEVEFWADGANRLHDRFRWSRSTLNDPWSIQRLNP